MNNKFPVKLGKSGSKIRLMLVQVYGDNTMKKTAVYMWVTHFSAGRESVVAQQQAELKKTLQKFIILCVKIVG
jgi:hypothetical protein